MKIFFLFLFSVALVFADEQLPPDRAEDIKLLTVMIDSDSRVGSGIIFDIRQDRVYIATANHVVRPGNAAATDIEVLFNWIPGETFKAVLLNPHDPKALDLAVIVVPDLARTRADKQQLPFDRLGSPETLKDRDALWAVGHSEGRLWEQSDLLHARKPNGVSVSLRDGAVADGYSGGPLVDGKGLIVGMAVQAKQATRIDRIIEQLVHPDWNFRAALKMRTGSDPTVGPTDSSEFDKAWTEGYRLSELRKFDEAVNYFEITARIRPAEYTLARLGSVLTQAAEPKTGMERTALLERAANSYQQAIQIKPDVNDCNNLAEVLWSLGKREESVDTAKRCVALLSKNPFAFWLLSYFSERAGRNSEALAAMKEVVKLQPNKAENYERLGELLIKAGGGEREIRDALEKAIQLDPTGPYGRLAQLKLKELKP